MEGSEHYKPGVEAGGGRFKIIKKLGEGGMGVVCLAEDSMLGEQLALKFLSAQLGHDEEAMEDMRRETRKSRQLTHPNIVRIHDIYHLPGEAPFISMEVIEGQALSSLKAEQIDRIFPWAYLEPLVAQMCDALDYAHEEKIVHRDLKPANLMLDSKGRIKIADFGLAATISDSMVKVSKDMGVSGTPSYMGPQQLDGLPSKATDDIYSLGATIYELLTSKPPFYKGNVLSQIKEVPAPPMADRLAEFDIENDIPLAVSRTVMACLEKDPARRPQSAGEVAELMGIAPGAGTRRSLKGNANAVALDSPEATAMLSRLDVDANPQPKPELKFVDPPKAAGPASRPPAAVPDQSGFDVSLPPHASTPADVPETIAPGQPLPVEYPAADAPDTDEPTEDEYEEEFAEPAAGKGKLIGIVAGGVVVAIVALAMMFSGGGENTEKHQSEAKTQNNPISATSAAAEISGIPTATQQANSGSTSERIIHEDPMNSLSGWSVRRPNEWTVRVADGSFSVLNPSTEDRRLRKTIDLSEFRGGRLRLEFEAKASHPEQLSDGWGIQLNFATMDGNPNNRLLKGPYGPDWQLYTHTFTRPAYAKEAGVTFAFGPTAKAEIGLRNLKIVELPSTDTVVFEHALADLNGFERKSAANESNFGIDDGSLRISGEQESPTFGSYLLPNILIPGLRYRLNVEMKTSAIQKSDPEKNQGPAAGLSWKVTGQPGMANVHGPAGSEDWQTKTLSFQFPLGALKPRLILRLNASTGTVWFRNVKIVQLSTAPTVFFEDSLGSLEGFSRMKGANEGNFGIDNGAIRIIGEQGPQARFGVRQLPNNLKPGQHYRLTIEMKTAEIEKSLPETNRGASAGLLWKAAGEIGGSFVFAPTGSAEWETRSLSFQVPDDAAFPRLALRLNASTGTVWFRNVKIVELPE